MAKITKSGHLKGTVGPVSYRVVNGQPTIQTNPGKGRIKQSVKTKQNATDFGRASRSSKVIRAALLPIVRDFEDSTFYRRMTGKIAEAIRMDTTNPAGIRQLIDGELSVLVNLQCNVQSKYSDYCRLQVDGGFTDDGRILLSLPQFIPKEAIVHIKNTSHATLRYLVISITSDALLESHAEIFEHSFHLNSGLIEAVNWSSEILPAGNIIIIASAIFYYRNNNLAGMIGLNNKNFHPCEVTAVLRS